MMDEYKNLIVRDGLIFGNPTDQYGRAYVNQWLPIRRATFMERLRAIFGMPVQISKGEQR